MATRVDLDAILVELGQFGRYQIRNYCLILLTIIFCAIYNSQYVFAAGAVDYRCKVPECESDPPEFKPESWGVWALPDTGGRCERLMPVGKECGPGNFLENITKTCTAWVYESNDTIVAAFDLACAEWKRTLVGTIHSAGVFISLAFVGYVSDTYGRLVALVLTATSPAIVGTLRAFSTSYGMYLSLELLDAIVGGGIYTTSFVLALEMFGVSKRVLGGNIISCVFALGQVAAALVAWAVPNWRTYTIVIYAPSILFLSYYWLVEESVRWLLSKGRTKEAAKIIFKVAEINKRKLSPESIKMLTENNVQVEEKISAPTEESNNKKSLFMQVIKSKVIMLRLCVCFVWWITLTFVYYGLSINSVSLAGNKYVNYILTSLVEIPGYCLSVVTMDRAGRKSSIMAAFLICAASLISLPLVPASLPWLQTSLNLLGKLFISMAFSSIYIYTGELFPTQARHTLLGLCSMAGRIGSIIAPQTPLLMAYMEALPYIVFGAMSGISGLLMMLTPETLAAKLPDTIEQAENIKSIKIKQTSENTYL